MSDNKTYPTENQSQILKEIKSRDVKNLHELPFFLASSNPNKEAVRIQFDSYKHPEGATLDRVINIYPAVVNGKDGSISRYYPDMLSQEYTSWLFHLWQQMPESDYQKGKVYWTRYQIHKLMGIGNGGRECQRHDNHFERIAGTSYGIDDSFYNKTDNKHIKQLRRFSILSSLNLTEMREGEVVMLDQCSAIINPLLVENFLKNYTKPLNLSVFSSIPRKAGITRKLYLKLDLHFGGQLNRFEMTTERFFRESGIIGSKYKNPSARKQNLEIAIKQLRGKKFSSNKTIRDYKFEKTADGKDWKVIIWAHQWGVINSLDFEEKPEQTNDIKPVIEVLNESGLQRLGDTIETQSVVDKTPDKPSKTITNTTKFINQFLKFFPNGDKHKLAKSRAIKSKVETFINDVSFTKSLDFLSYCHELSQKNQFSILSNAQTPNYLFSFKVGDDSIVNTWQQDRAAEHYRKQEDKKTEQRRLEYSKDKFEMKMKPLHQHYVDVFISSLSEEEQQDFEEFFQEKQQAMLELKNESYKKIYFNSKVTQKHFSFECLREFSQRLTEPFLSLEEWIKIHHSEEYQQFYK